VEFVKSSFSSHNQGNGNRLTDYVLIVFFLKSQNADSHSSIEEGSKTKLISWWKIGPIIACVKVKVQVAVF
jgi:hypothetical protein